MGWTSAGEWLHHTVGVATAGTYTIDVRVASTGTGGRFHVEANGVDITGSMAVPNGSGQLWCEDMSLEHLRGAFDQPD